MPSTVTATWPDLVAGKKAKASEVEAKFDWLEGTLWPMMSGTTADLTYDLGSDGKSWRSAWLGSINPTTTASGIAMGTTTANASTCLDLSGMPKAMLMPMLTTTQRNALTAAEGMLIYNTTNTRMERYEGGQWLSMANPMGLVGRVKYNQFSPNTTAALQITGSGRIRAVEFLCSAGGTEEATEMYIFLDGTKYTININSLATTTSRYISFKENTSTVFEVTTASSPLDVYYKSSFEVWFRGDQEATHTNTVYLTYEAA